MRGLRAGAIILWSFCVSVLVSIGPLQGAPADVCLPGDNETDYPTEQRLYFDLQADAAASAGVNDARTTVVRARLSGSDKPLAKLKVYPRQRKKEQSLLTVTVVPIISTDRATNELVASLDVTEKKLPPLLLEPRFEEMVERVKEALRGWEKRLTPEQKIEIQKYGTLDLIPDLGGAEIEGVSPRAPLRVAFVAPIKNPLVLYDIAKGLESRLGQYAKLERKYSGFEGSKLKDGLVALDKLDRELALFDPDLTSKFESAVRLQRKVASRKSRLTSLEEDLATARARQREIKETPVPVTYVNADKGRRSSRNKPGFRPLDDALRRAENVDRSLYQTLRDNYDETTEQLYRKNLAKLDWLKKTKIKSKDRTDRRRSEGLDEINRTIAGLEQGAAPVREEYRNLNRKKADLLSRLRAYYRRLKSNIDDTNSAPDLNNFETDKEAEDALYEVMDWINNQQGYIEGERARIDRGLGRHIRQLVALDRRLEVLTRDIADRRQQASCWAIRALKKDKNGKFIEVLSDFNKLAGGLKDAVSESSDRAGKLDYGRKIFTDSKLDWLKKFGERIKILSKSAERIKSWTGPVEKLLVLNQQFEKKNPMFFVGVLEGAGDIAGKVPVIGSTVKAFLDYNAFLSKRILERAQLIHGHLAQQALDLLLTSDGQRNLPPGIHLYAAKDIRAAIETKLFSASDAEVQEVATEFQIKRIKHLLANGSKSRGLR